MLAGHRHWIDLLNSQLEWTTDSSMLAGLPEDAREFSEAEPWPRLKALAYLGNNVELLRESYEALESGRALDEGLLGPVLESVRLGLVHWRKDAGLRQRGLEGLTRGELPTMLRVVPDPRGWNRGTTAVRFLVQRAFFWFARYAEARHADPCWPGATPGCFRVLPCPQEGCRKLVPAPCGDPAFCRQHSRPGALS